MSNLNYANLGGESHDQDKPVAMIESREPFMLCPAFLVWGNCGLCRHL